MAAVTKETMIGDLLRIDAETKCGRFGMNQHDMMSRLQRDPGAAQRVMESADGQALMQMLSGPDGGAGLQQAMTQASAGNTAQLASMLRQVMQPLNPVFSEPQYSTDNAMGVAVLAYRHQEVTDGAESIIHHADQ